MDISNIKGQGPLERPNGRDRVGGQDTGKLKQEQPALGGGESVRDEAVISSRGKDALAAVDALAERARSGGEDRAEIVAAAKAKLESGALDQPDVYRNVAEQMLREGLA